MDLKTLKHWIDRLKFLNTHTMKSVFSVQSNGGVDSILSFVSVSDK